MREYGTQKSACRTNIRIPSTCGMRAFPSSLADPSPETRNQNNARHCAHLFAPRMARTTMRLECIARIFASRLPPSKGHPAHHFPLDDKWHCREASKFGESVILPRGFLGSEVSQTHKNDCNEGRFFATSAWKRSLPIAIINLRLNRLKTYLCADAYHHCLVEVD